LCSLAFRAASACTAATRATSVAASLASSDESVVVTESEEDAADSQALFLALFVTVYVVLPFKPEIVKGYVVVPAEI